LNFSPQTSGAAFVDFLVNQVDLVLNLLLLLLLFLLLLLLLLLL
jgi:fumarate reductase subunit C